MNHSQPLLRVQQSFHLNCASGHMLHGKGLGLALTHPGNRFSQLESSFELNIGLIESRRNVKAGRKCEIKHEYTHHKTQKNPE